LQTQACETGHKYKIESQGEHSGDIFAEGTPGKKAKVTTEIVNFIEKKLLLGETGPLALLGLIQNDEGLHLTAEQVPTLEQVRSAIQRVKPNKKKGTTVFEAMNDYKFSDLDMGDASDVEKPFCLNMWSFSDVDQEDLELSDLLGDGSDDNPFHVGITTGNMINNLNIARKDPDEDTYKAKLIMHADKTFKRQAKELISAI